MNIIIRVMFFALLLSILNACVSTDNATGREWPKEKRVNLHVELGMNYLRRNNLKTARESFEKAIQIDSRSSSAYHGLGLVEAKEFNLNLAHQYLETAIDLNVENYLAIGDYAILLCQSGETTRAIKLLERTVVPRNQSQITISLARGRCYEANQDLVKAELSYAKILDENGSIHQALLSMSGIKYKTRNFLSARGFIQRYFSTNVTSPKALLLAAKIENELNNVLERNKYAQTLWRRFPKSDQAVEARKIFR